MYFLCKMNKINGIVEAEHITDAVLEFDRLFLTDDEQEEEIRNCDDSTNNYCQKLIAEYNAHEIHRHDVMEYVERRIDGDKNILILFHR